MSVVLVGVGGALLWGVLNRPGKASGTSTISAPPCASGRIDLPYATFTVPTGLCYAVTSGDGFTLGNDTGTVSALVRQTLSVSDAADLCRVTAGRLSLATPLPQTRWGEKTTLAGYSTDAAAVPSRYIWCIVVNGYFHTFYGSTDTGGVLTTDAPDTFILAQKALFASWVWK